MSQYKSNLNPLDGAHFPNDLGIKLINWGDGQAEMEILVIERLTNRLGVAHGGVISTLLDQSLGLAWRSLREERIPGGTINLNVNFIAPGRGRLRAIGQWISFTKSTAFCEGRVLNETGQVIATAQGIFSARQKTD